MAIDAIPTRPLPDWEPILTSPEKISSYIDEQSTGFVDREFIEEYLWGCGARLRLVPIAEIKEGHPDQNVRSKKKEARYAKLALATMPPIVINMGVVEDGNHRFREAVRRGVEAIWCYEVLEIEQFHEASAAAPSPTVIATATATTTAGPSF
jgi:hypothetical protein